jgi:hypothetical protein
MKKIVLYFIILVIHLSCVSKKIGTSFTGSNAYLDFINDSIFEYKYYHNGYDTMFLQYSFGTYKSIKKNLYLLNSSEFNNLSFPIIIIEDYDTTKSDSIRISFKTNISGHLFSVINTTLELDSLKFKIGREIFDTVVSKRHIRKIKVNIVVPKNSGLPRLNYTYIQSKVYLVKNLEINKLAIFFPINDYLFNFVSLKNQLIEKRGKFLILKSENGNTKVLNGGKIFHWWEYQ